MARFFKLLHACSCGVYKYANTLNGSTRRGWWLCRSPAAFLHLLGSQSILVISSSSPPISSEDEKELVVVVHFSLKVLDGSPDLSQELNVHFRPVILRSGRRTCVFSTYERLCLVHSVFRRSAAASPRRLPLERTSRLGLFFVFFSSAGGGAGRRNGATSRHVTECRASVSHLQILGKERSKNSHACVNEGCACCEAPGELWTRLRCSTYHGARGEGGG